MAGVISDVQTRVIYELEDNYGRRGQDAAKRRQTQRAKLLPGKHGRVCLVAAGGCAEPPAPRLSVDYEAARSGAARVVAAARGEAGGAGLTSGPAC